MIAQAANTSPPMAEPFDIDGAKARDTQRADNRRAANEAADKDLRFVMGDARGRRFVWSLLEEAGVFRSTFNVSALAMAHAEGGRNQGLRLLNRLLRTTPAEYRTAQEEASA